MVGGGVQPPEFISESKDTARKGNQQHLTGVGKKVLPLIRDQIAGCRTGGSGYAVPSDFAVSPFLQCEHKQRRRRRAYVYGHMSGSVICKMIGDERMPVFMIVLTYQ